MSDTTTTTALPEATAPDATPAPATPVATTQAPAATGTPNRKPFLLIAIIAAAAIVGGALFGTGLAVGLAIPTGGGAGQMQQGGFPGGGPGNGNGPGQQGGSDDDSDSSGS